MKLPAPTGLNKSLPRHTQATPGLPAQNRVVLTVQHFNIFTVRHFNVLTVLTELASLSTLHAPAKPIIHRYQPTSSRYQTATDTANLRLFAPIRGHYRLSEEFARIDKSRRRRTAFGLWNFFGTWRLGAWSLSSPTALDLVPVTFGNLR
jgi:hypothetical protein